MLSPDDVAPHLLTEEEYNAFRRDGYLMLRKCITDKRFLEELETDVDVIDTGMRERFHDDRGKELTDTGTAIALDFLHRAKSFLELAIYPTFFHKIWNLMGWNIYCDHTNLIVNPPFIDREEHKDRERPIIKELHPDDGRLHVEVENNSLFAIKAAIFLTDLTQPLNGNLCILPGSHKRWVFDHGTPQEADPQKLTWVQEIHPSQLSEDDQERIIPVLAEPGDVLIFDRRLWHTRSKNLSEITRKVFFYGYAYRWQIGNKTYTEREIEKLSARYEHEFNIDEIYKQILGFGRNRSTTIYPMKTDAPLQKFAYWVQSQKNLRYLRF